MFRLRKSRGMRLFALLPIIPFVLQGCNGSDQAAAPAATSPSLATTTPIKHLIVIIGENHSFDNVFGVYNPVPGQTIDNLLSKGIVTSSGTPGANYALAAQQQASVTATYSLAPTQTGPYATLPQPNTTYAFYQTPDIPDPRFPANLPNGPFQISQYVPYDNGYTGDPVHRFFQMWQQYDQGKMDLFTWVATTVGIGPNNLPAVTPATTYQGGLAMGFNNMVLGDAPKFRFMADNYAISDNYHQAIMGGTGANFFAIGSAADVAYYNDGNGNPVAPPANQVENPNPQAGTNNFYTQDGYKGGSYVGCADNTQPGVSQITAYLNSLAYKPFNNGNCAANTYYLVNNYNPGYTPAGMPATLGANVYTTPPQTVPMLADSLSAKGVTWKWYSGGWNNGNPTSEYCGICDPFVFSKSVMTTSLRSNLQDVPQFYQDVANNTLPAVSFVRPYESQAGHPADSTLSAYEKFVTTLIDTVKSNPTLWASTAIVITTDEGGGYYDHGYIQPIDFFGDGTRIPLILISPYAKAGYVDHNYQDHASIAKFIEANWGLKPLSARSRDNLPNPTPTAANPYIPANAPAIGDLMTLFDFTHFRSDAPAIPIP